MNVFDKLRSAFGIRADESNTTQSNETSDAPAQPEPLTQEDMIRLYAEQLRNMSEQEKEQYKRDLENLLSSGAGTVSEQIAGQSIGGGSAANERSELRSNDTAAKVSEPELSETPTVEELVNFILHKVDRALEERLSKLQPAQPPVPPAYFLVDRLVRQNPTLSSVAEDTIKLMERLPIQFQTMETADFIAWFLKGKRSEAEKKEAFVSLFAEDAAPSPSNVTLPYSNEDISAYAEAMGIDPKRFKIRLLEEMQKANAIHKR